MNPIQFAHLFVDHVKKSGHKAYIDKDSYMWIDPIRLKISEKEYCPLTFVAKMEKSIDMQMADFPYAARLLGLSLDEASDVAAAADNDRSNDPKIRKILLSAIE